MTYSLIYRVLGTDRSRIQRGRVINDQTFDPYAIIADGRTDAVRTSRRQPPYKDSTFGASPLMRGLTVTGTAISVLAHLPIYRSARHALVNPEIYSLWQVDVLTSCRSASTAQLAATILMTAVRAFLCRGMARRPSSAKLSSEFELEWLATELRDTRTTSDLTSASTAKLGRSITRRTKRGVPSRSSPVERQETKRRTLTKRRRLIRPQWHQKAHKNRSDLA